ncbi:hypothetical protein BG004_004195 [Podila humilis]|nr:hypothetical protein BG004_004195 [Podila humilis]
MVYATRSRDSAKARPTAASVRALGETKAAPKKKRATHQATKSRKLAVAKKPTANTTASSADKEKTSTTTTVPPAPAPIRRISLTINPLHLHLKHPLDGKDHHVIEQDGHDRHHIWYHDFSENEDNGHHKRQRRQSIATSEPHAPEVQNNRRGRRASSQSALSSQSKTIATPVEKPLTIHVDNNEHVKHRLDGKDHHIIENDGFDHHHIRFDDREVKGKTHTAAAHSTAATVGATGATRVEFPLSIHIDQHQGKHHMDGKEHHDLGSDGVDHHHIRYSARQAKGGSLSAVASQTGSGGARKRSNRSTVVATDSHPEATAIPPADDTVVAHRVTRSGKGDSKGRSSATSSSSTATKNLGKTVVHTEISKGRIPVHKVDSSELKGHGSTATTSHYEGSDTTTTSTTTTTTTSKDALLEGQEQHHRPHTREEASVRLLAQKSQLDRQKARVAISSLDSDVAKLQKLLREKEAALRDAEARSIAEANKEVTIRTETLTREIRDLEITIQDLRTNLANQEMTDQKKIPEQQKKLKNEISKLHVDLKRKDEIEKKVEEQSNATSKQLELAVTQRDKLAGQVKDMSERLKHRETELRASQTAIRGLERSNAAKSLEAQKLSGQLANLKKEMHAREKELKHSHAQIKSLEGSHKQVLALQKTLQRLKTTLTDREGTLKNLRKSNKALTHDSENLGKLEEEVKTLKEDIYTREDQLKIAKQKLEDLEGYRDHAATLEVEVIGLRDELAAEEKHQSDLEEALMLHENCAFKEQQLQEENRVMDHAIDERGEDYNQLHAEMNNMQSAMTQMVDAMVEEREIVARADADMREQAKTIENLQKDIKAKEAMAAKLKENSDNEIAKLHSACGTLKIEVLGLRQQIKDKNTELKQSENKVKELATALQEQSAAKESSFSQPNLGSQKDHGSQAHQMKEMQALIADLRKQVKDAGKKTKTQLKQKEEEIVALMSRTSILTQELEHEKTLLSDKDRTLSVASQEIGRLNNIVLQIRTELAQDHKRRASEIEESSKANQQQSRQLNQHIHSLEDANQHLEKKAHLEHEHSVVHEGELEAKVQELLVWQQNSIIRTMQLEGTVAELEIVKEKQNQQLAHSERQLRDLQSQLAEANQWRERSLEQSENLNGLVNRLEKDRKMLKGTVAKADKEDENMQVHLSRLQGEIQSAENDKMRLQQEIMIKETLIAELQDKVEEENDKYQRILAVHKKDMVAKKQMIQNLNSRIAEFERITDSLESTIYRYKDQLSTQSASLSKLQSQLSKMTEGKTTLESRVAQLQQGSEKEHKALEKEHQALLHERSLAAEEKKKDEETIQALKMISHKMEQEFREFETKMGTTKELTDKLAILRKSMLKDSQTELKRLDELEEEIKTRSSVVEESIQTTRNRMDSGAFLETAISSDGTAHPSSATTTMASSGDVAAH